MKFRFLALTLGLVMALASVSVFAENAPNKLRVASSELREGSERPTGANSGNRAVARTGSGASPIDNDAIAALIPALPENGSGSDYLGYIHASQNAKNKAIETLKAKAQEKGQNFTIDNIRAIESAFIQKDIEAATMGMAAEHCTESAFANLAVFKAQFLFVKWQLFKDQNAQAELAKFTEKLKADGKDTTLQHVLGKINGLNSQFFRARLNACVQSQNAEEMGRLVNEMNAALAAVNNGKDATPEMAQDAIMLMFLVQKVPAYKPQENLIPKYLNILSNATNPETKKVVDNVKQQLVNAIRAAQEKERQKQAEEQKKKEEEQKKQEEQEPEQEKLPENLI